MPSIFGLVTSAAVTVENKIPEISILVEKTAYNANIRDFKCKYFTTPDYDKCTSQTLDAKIKQKALLDQSAIAGFINNTDLNKKVATLATKTALKTEQNKITK